jgi:putative tryptophan/tyrosine transport system substrate-binding protein
MQRREFITLFGGAAAAWPVSARAQQPAKMKRIALVDPSLKVGDMTVGGARAYRAFFKEMSHLGYVEGRNLVVERYSGEGRIERYPPRYRQHASRSDLRG